MTEEKADPKDKTILIVDDDESVCIFLKTLLEKEGFVTETTHDGNEAIKTVESKKIDLVILDWMMPVMSGFEILKSLQADEFRSIPIIVITARVSDRRTVDMIKQEMNVAEFTSKPIKHALFVTRVHQILNTISKDEQRIRQQNLQGGPGSAFY